MNATDSVRSQDHPLRHHRRRRNRNLCLDRGVTFLPAPLIPGRRDTESFHPFRPLSHWYDRHGIAALRTHHQSVSRRSVQRSERGLPIVATAKVDVRGLVRGVWILCCGNAVRGLDFDCSEAGACEVDLVWRIRMQDNRVQSGIVANYTRGLGSHLECEIFSIVTSHAHLVNTVKNGAKTATVNRSLVQRSCLELPFGIVAIHLRSPMPKHLPLPDKDPSPRQDEQPNRTNSIEDIWNANRRHPGRHRKDEDRAEDIPQEGKRGERVTDDFCKHVSILEFFPGIGQHC